MHVLNIHERTYDLTKDQLTDLFNTLASPDDQVWPKEKWPKMKLDNGLNPGSKGGHGPIRYFVESHLPGEQIAFRFTKPQGFNGVHKFDIKSISPHKTKLIHTIDMQVTPMAYFKWILMVKWLHDALIEDGLDKIQNKTTKNKKVTSWNAWVRLLRLLLK